MQNDAYSMKSLNNFQNNPTADFKFCEHKRTGILHFIRSKLKLKNISKNFFRPLLQEKKSHVWHNSGAVATIVHTTKCVKDIYAAISNAHLSRVCKRGKLSGSCLSTLNGFGSTQLPIFLCHIGVPTFSSQNN